MSFTIDDSYLKGIKVVSFDLFDTVFLRSVSHPRDIFYFLGIETQHLHKLSPEKFQRIRVQCEGLSKIYLRLFRAKEETNIYEIYNLIQKRINLSDETKFKLISMELRLEGESIFLNDDISDLLNRLKGIGFKIIFTSDMYLPNSFILGLLNKYGLTANSETLYLSSNLVKTKRRKGSLFDLVINKEGIDYHNLLHVGDDPVCDYAIPLLKGIKVIRYEKKSPQVINNSKWHKLPQKALHSYCLSLSYKTYISNTHSYSDINLNALSSYISGPVLFAYVYWLINKAINLKLKRLYFLSRDGEILLKIAQQIKTHYNLDIELRYLYASRLSWILPSIIDFDNIEQESAFFNFAKEFTVRSLLHRFKLDVLCSDLDPILVRYNLTIDERINVINLNNVKKFIKNKALLTLIKRKSEEEYNLLDNYFSHEGLYDSVDYGLVDVGWRGTLSNSLRRFLIKKGISHDINIVTFYFDILRQPLLKERDIFLSFLKDNNIEYSNPMRGELEVLMELFTYGTHQSVYGFTKSNNTIKPIFMEENLDEKIDWGILDQHNMILNYVAQVLKCQYFEDIDKNEYYRQIMAYLYYFLHEPEINMVIKLAQFPYNTEMVRKADEYNYSISSPFYLKDLVEMVRRVHIVRKNDSWIQGSLALTENLLTKRFFKTFYGILSSRPIRKIEARVRNRMRF